MEDSAIAKLGSLIITNKANYFLAISAGEIRIDNKAYYAISPSSPIGQLLLGRQLGDTINFAKEMLIKAIYWHTIINLTILIKPYIWKRYYSSV